SGADGTCRPRTSLSNPRLVLGRLAFNRFTCIRCCRPQKTSPSTWLKQISGATRWVSIETYCSPRMLTRTGWQHRTRPCCGTYSRPTGILDRKLNGPSQACGTACTCVDRHQSWCSRQQRTIQDPSDLSSMNPKVLPDRGGSRCRQILGSPNRGLLITTSTGMPW